MNQHSTTTDELLELVLDDAYPLWLTVLEAAEEMPEFRTTQSTRQAMNKRLASGLVERQIRDGKRSPFEYRNRRETV